jgi:hypothetical protein
MDYNQLPQVGLFNQHRRRSGKSIQGEQTDEGDFVIACMLENQ